MTKPPAYWHKHACVGCDTGYLFCVQGLASGLKCCKSCDHPTRWEFEPYTPEEIEDLWARYRKP